MSDESEKPIPALFATIHFRSERRPDGYTAEEIAELNELANQHLIADDPKGDAPDPETRSSE